MNARHTGFDRGASGIRRARARGVAAILAAAWLAGLGAPGPAGAVLAPRGGSSPDPGNSSLPTTTTTTKTTTTTTTTVPACPDDVCAKTDTTVLYAGALQSAISALEPFTIKAGNNTEIDVENLMMSFSCTDLRQNDEQDCEDQAWADYQAAVDGTHTKPGPWSDIPDAWDDYQEALDNCDKQLSQPYRGQSDVEISADLTSGHSHGSISVTAKLEIDLCRAQVCLTNIEYDYDMGGWVGFWGDLASAFGSSPDITLVDGTGKEYPLSDGGSGDVCIPLSDVF